MVASEELLWLLVSFSDPRREISSPLLTGLLTPDIWESVQSKVQTKLLYIVITNYFVSP